jgi:hypothetical protein
MPSTYDAGGGAATGTLPRRASACTACDVVADGCDMLAVSGPPGSDNGG